MTRAGSIRAVALLLLATTTGASAAPLVYAEYVVASGSPDNDPGLGQGISIAVPTNSGSVSLALTIPPENLPLDTPGTYRIAIRARDAEDRWTTMTRTFHVPAPLPDLPRQGDLTHVEAFVTTTSIPNLPPSYVATSLLAPPVTPSSNGVFATSFTPAQLSALNPGIYRLGVRACDEHGLWTTVSARTFAIPGATAPQFYYPRWRLRDGSGNVLQSGSFSSSPLELFPAEFELARPVEGTGTRLFEVALEDFQGAPGVSRVEEFAVVSHADYWRESYFTNPSARANPAVSGPLADPNGDGVNNLTAFVLGIDPERPAPPLLHALSGPPGSPKASLRLPREIPPGSSVRLLGNTELDTTFPTASEITPPLSAVAAATFTGQLALDSATGLSTWWLTPPAETDWDEQGFFCLKVHFDGPWPYDEPP